MEELFDEYLKRVEAYRKLPEEADAYAVQAKFRKAMVDHQEALLRAETDAMPPTVRSAKVGAPR